MMRYIVYMKYIIRHKWFVLKAGMKYFPSLHLLYRLLVHDLSKLTPVEYIAYAKCFYKPDGSKQYVEDVNFCQAWNHHQKRNLHHWQYWVLKYDRGENEFLPMPDIYVEEMIADWIGAGMAITGKWDNVFGWYEKADISRFFHEETKEKVEKLLEELKVKMNYETI